jgi:hypothetical protein
MRERARELRGEFRIQSQPGQGTVIEVTAPVSPAPGSAVPPGEAASGAPALPIGSPAV